MPLSPENLSQATRELERMSAVLSLRSSLMEFPQDSCIRLYSQDSRIDDISVVFAVDILASAVDDQIKKHAATLAELGVEVETWVPSK